MTQIHDGNISELWVYPIKSCAGIKLEQSNVKQTGLVNDRRYMLVGGDNKFITQRKHAKLASVKLEIADRRLGISIKGFGQSHLEIGGHEAELLQAEIWGDQIDCLEAKAEVSAFFSDFLGESVRLVQLARADGRSREKKGVPYLSSLADSAPLLVTSTSSLEAINDKYGLKIPMSRFRPNVVVSGWSAWQERGCGRININNLDFTIAYDCVRCPVITIDQENGEKSGKQPLSGLLEMFPGEPALFGLRSASKDEGIISVGDPCSIL